MPKPSIIHLPHHRQEQGASCLAACVVMVLAHWQVVVSESEVRRILKTKSHAGTHPVSLLRLRELGFETWPYDGTEEELRQRIDVGIPVIVFLWTGALPYWSQLGGVDYLHSVVVVGYTHQAVWVHDPVLSEGPIALAWTEFTGAWAYSRQMMATIEPIA